MRRLVVPPEQLVIGQHTLDVENQRYAKDVLRLRAGMIIEVIDGEGHIGRARIVEAAKRVVIAVEETRDAPIDRGPEITLIQAVGKGDKVDDVVRQASELGVRRIVPVLTERTVAEHRSREERWRAIADDAMRVSGRARRASIEDVKPLAEVLKTPRFELAICCDGAATRGLRDHLSQSGNPGRIELMIGPEGGFTDEERADIDRAGLTRIHLGACTLRTETAGPAVSAILLYQFGAFEREPI